MFDELWYPIFNTTVFDFLKFISTTDRFSSHNMQADTSTI